MKTIRDYRMELTEKQWQIIQKLLPQHKKGRKPIDRRKIINALFYLVLFGANRLSVAKFTEVFSQVEDRIYRFLAMAERRCLAKDSRRLVRDDPSNQG